MVELYYNAMKLTLDDETRKEFQELETQNEQTLLMENGMFWFEKKEKLGWSD